MAARFVAGSLVSQVVVLGSVRSGVWRQLREASVDRFRVRVLASILRYARHCGLDDEHADAAAEAALAAAQQRPHRRLALMLGRARGVELPWPLASALPGAFVQTWGRWSARALRRRAAGAGTAG